MEQVDDHRGDPNTAFVNGINLQYKHENKDEYIVSYTQSELNTLIEQQRQSQMLSQAGDEDENENEIKTNRNNDNNEILFYFAQPHAKKRLLFRLAIHRVSNIDTMAETFQCRFTVNIIWLATKNEYLQYLTQNKGEYVPDWIPTSAIRLINGASYVTPQLSKAFKIKRGERIATKGWALANDEMDFNPMHGYFNRARYEFELEFAEEFELETFPFDVC